MNKIMARILTVRIQTVIDPLLLGTQFGFRPNKSTADAIYCVRRLLTQTRCTKDENVLIFLDWEKAFDTVSHEAMHFAMERMNIPKNCAT